MLSKAVDSIRCSTPSSVMFDSLTSEDIRKLSVREITNSFCFTALGNPVPGGLFDSALGPAKSGSNCSTCFAAFPNCLGHFGHIELPLPVFNPLYLKQIHFILKISCLECFKSLIPENFKYIFIGAMTLLRNGFVNQALDLEERFRKSNNMKIETLKQNVDNFVSEVLSLADNDNTQPFKGEESCSMFLKLKLVTGHRSKVCPNCKARLKKVLNLQRKFLIPTKLVVANKHKNSQATSIEQSSVSGYNFLMPPECKQYFINIYNNEKEFINQLFPVIASSKETNPTDIFFLSAIPVSPPVVRPISFAHLLECEHPQNKIYKGILDNIAVAKILINMINNSEDESDLSPEKRYLIKRLNGTTYSDKFAFVSNEIQDFISAILDVDTKPNLQSIGLKQVLEKKAGIIRKNMMGKRVNYAARTVITPDPNLNINEIGVPDAFAKILTFPVPVTPWNVEELRKMVLNGPLVHPGANFLESEDGSYIRLFPEATAHRVAIAKRLLTPGDVNGVKIVHRHLKNGDILLLNRQPTLHKPGIMAHSARILKDEKTFRLHYANCKAYNADFDGDEMNAHLPQNLIARTEGTNLVNVTQQYLVPKDGTPLSGLIQDHMVSGVKLTLRDTFFNKTDYMNLVYQGISSLGSNIITLPPCMLKPAVLWSGKQVLSTVIINVIPKGHFRVNLESKSKISHKAWIRGKEKPWKAGGTPFKTENCMTEAEVIIRDGELLSGVLDKMHYGATPYSLAHCVNELYGGEVATQLLSSFAKLFTAFLQIKGFTLGIKDILVVKKADKKRSNILQKAREIGDAIVSDIIDIPPNQSVRETLNEANMNDPKFRNVWDYAFKKALDSVTDAVNKVCLPKGLLVPFPQNNIQLMVESGAKGSTVNTMQISCLLGQIELEGKRPPLMSSGRALPSFQPYDTSPRAGGFVDGRFLTGIKPQEFFFHCMAGREGLIDTAVKTSRSGYLQRCLVKHLEGLSVNYDMTVRDSDGSVVQFLYGEDGLEVTKCQFLKEHQMPFLIDNINAIYDANLIELLKSSPNNKAMESLKKVIRRWKRKRESGLTKSTPFLEFCKEKFQYISSEESLKRKKGLLADSKIGRLPTSSKLIHMWNELSPEEKRRYSKLSLKSPDTVPSKFKSHIHFGSLTERLDEMIDKYMKTNDLQYDPEIIRDMVYLKVQRSLCEPGEPVGLLAAQSIGEPSTQMTLNTFHFAGRGEMNVTLGIPRLKEILMGKSSSTTPIMEIPFNPNVDNTFKEHFRKEFTRLTMFDVLEKIDVYKKLQFKPTRRLLYTLKIHILPPAVYQDNISLSPKKMVKFVGKTFSLKFAAFIQKSKNIKNDLIQERKQEKETKQDSDNEEPTKQNDYNPESESDSEESNIDNEDAKLQSKMDTGDESCSDKSDSDESNVENEDTKLQSKMDKGEDEDFDVEKDSTENRCDATVDGDQINDENSETGKVSQFKYTYDKKTYQWCTVSLVFDVNKMEMDLAGKLREFAAQTVISSVPGIRKAFLVTHSNQEVTFKTDGINIEEMYKHGDKFNLNRLYANDIHSICRYYGIEAANKALTKEVKDVFKVYGITVDPRHLSLIADYMTFSGTVQGLNRGGFTGHCSPLQKMSFESSLSVLRSTVFRNQKDNLMSPSARVMLGLPIALGTSCFDLMYSLTDLST